MSKAICEKRIIAKSYCHHDSSCIMKTENVDVLIISKFLFLDISMCQSILDICMCVMIESSQIEEIKNDS